MSNAYRDENSVPTIIAASNLDGLTPIRIKIESLTHRLKTSDGTTGSDFGTVNDRRDENSVVCLMAVSSSDGMTPTTVYADSSGNLLIQTT